MKFSNWTEFCKNTLGSRYIEVEIESQERAERNACNNHNKRSCSRGDSNER